MLRKIASLLPLMLVLAATALIRPAISLLQDLPWLWLALVAIGGPWLVWKGASQLYTAAMHGYVITGVPERRVYKADDPWIFRNNVIAWIICFPMISAGVVIIAFDALEAVHLIK